MSVWDVFVHERMPLVLAHQEIDRIGVRIDVEYLDRLSEELGSALVRLEDAIQKEAGYPIKPSSPPQVAKLLFTDLELPVVAWTDGGAPSTKEEVLIQYREAHPVVNLILQHRAYAKIKGTYVDGTKDDGKKKALRAALDEDGHARMDTRLHGTETFRFVTRKPFAIHTWPKDQAGFPSVRALIIPEEGHRFISADSVQQEFAIIAIASNQKDLIDAMLDRGEDIHERVMNDLMGVSRSQFQTSGGHWLSHDAEAEYKQQRTHGKSLNFMVLYRGGPPKLARMLGCKHLKKEPCNCPALGGKVVCLHERAANFIFDYYDRYEEIKYWQYQVIKDLHRTGMVRGLFGLYRKLPSGVCAEEDEKNIDYHPRKWEILDAERAACNFPIQNAGYHVMARALLGIYHEFKRRHFPGRIVFSVHDELLVEVREDMIEEGAEVIRRHMTQPHPELGGRGIRADLKVLRRWGGE